MPVLPRGSPCAMPVGPVQYSIRRVVGGNYSTSTVAKSTKFNICHVVGFVGNITRSVTVTVPTCFQHYCKSNIQWLPQRRLKSALSRAPTLRLVRASCLPWPRRRRHTAHSLHSDSAQVQCLRPLPPPTSTPPATTLSHPVPPRFETSPFQKPPLPSLAGLALWPWKSSRRRRQLSRPLCQ